VRYYVAKKPRVEGEPPVFVGAAGLRIYAEPTAFPRAWAVKRVKRVESEEIVESQIGVSTPEQLRETAFFADGDPKVETCEGEDSVVFRKVRPTSYVVDAVLPCRRMIVVGNTYFPDWVVRVDGKPTEMYQVDRALQGFVVPGGKHKVEVTYRPTKVFLGAGISVTALLLFGFLGLITRSVRRDEFDLVDKKHVGRDDETLDPLDLGRVKT